MNEDAELRLFRKKIATGLITAFAVYLLFLSAGVLAKLGIAILLMVILDPLVKILINYMPKKNRLLAILATFSLLGAFVLIVLASLVPLITTQGGEALANLNSAAESAQASGQTLSEALAANSPSDSLSALMPYVAKAVPQITSFLAATISALLSGVFAQLMVFGFVLFGLIEGPHLVATVKSLLPKKYKSEIIWIADNGYHNVTSYITGNLLISLIAGVFTFLFCLIIGLPNAFLMAVAVAICDLIPMFGAYLFGLVLGLFSFLYLGLDAATIAVIYVIIYQQFENQILGPIVYNKANKLTPLTVLVSVSLGGAMAGLLGALIAIPVGSTIQATIQRYQMANKVKA